MPWDGSPTNCKIYLLYTVVLFCQRSLEMGLFLAPPPPPKTRSPTKETKETTKDWRRLAIVLPQDPCGLRLWFSHVSRVSRFLVVHDQAYWTDTEISPSLETPWLLSVWAITSRIDQTCRSPSKPITGWWKKAEKWDNNVAIGRVKWSKNESSIE